MDEPHAVNRRNRRFHLVDDGDQLAPRESPRPEHSLQRLAAHEPGGDESAAVPCARLVDGNDTRVVERGGCALLVEEAALVGEPLEIGGVEQPQGRRPLERYLRRLVHGST